MTNKDLEQLITEYGKDIYSFCVHLTGNRDIADDLYQETFLVAVNRRRTLVKIEEPKAYLLSVAVHVWTNMKRKYARRMGIAPETSYDDA
jgi:RNA polymerase sigma-70 factor (ECF subfamily)